MILVFNQVLLHFFAANSCKGKHVFLPRTIPTDVGIFLPIRGIKTCHCAERCLRITEVLPLSKQGLKQQNNDAHRLRVPRLKS